LEINLAEISFEPPTFQGTTNLISRAGKSAAMADPRATKTTNVEAAIELKTVLKVFIFTPLATKHINVITNNIPLGK
jgi:hypothetical protein